MFKKSHPLQSKSEIILRNIVVIAMIAFFSIFLIVPIGIAFAGSFHEWNPLSGTYNFLGLENYKEVFTSSLFGKSMLNTLIFSVVVIIFRVGLGLGIAYAIYSPLVKHKSFFRAIYYMPVVTPMVAVAFVWKFMYNPQIGTINQIFGLDVNWLMNPKIALLAVIIMTIWKDFGYAVVMYMAGLYSLPSDALEAAKVDGANGWQLIRFVELPLCRISIGTGMLCSITSRISMYEAIALTTAGGPGDDTMSLSVLLVRAITDYNYGFANAIGVIMFLIGLLVMYIVTKAFRMNDSIY